MKIYAIATGAAVALALVVAPSASAAVKEGAACKKAGQSSTVSGRKFTCVKKGSKLVWNKGVVIKSAPTAAASAAPAAPAMSATPMATKSAEPSKSAAPVAAGYTMERVKANGTTSSCWAVISGNVYDLTKWIGSHPGGSGAIASLCGTDGTSEFLAMHRNQNKPEARLAGYLLGPLSK